MALTLEQIETRRSYIGGSDARTVLEGDGAAWQALRAEKVDGVRPVFKPAQQLLMDMGTAIEPLCLREMNKKIPLRPLAADHHIVWKTDPILAFTPDGLAYDDGSVVQCKFHTGDQTILDLAQTYKAQLTHEMICADAQRMWLAVIFGHYGRFQHMEIKRDEALVDQYLMKAMEFKEFITTNELPESMVGEIVEMKVDRKRDHVWPAGDNEIAPLAHAIIDNMMAAAAFEEALAEVKKLIKRKEYADCASLTWRDEEGYGVVFKPDARGAVRYSLAFPKRPKPKGTVIAPGMVLKKASR